MRRLPTLPPPSRLAALTAGAPLLAACAGAAPPEATPEPTAAGPAPTLLAGTRWELVSLQSMDDAQGTTRIPDPTRYTLLFGADGRAAFRLDCNRATGTWTATATADGRTGSLRFGQLAGTRAMCAPPSLDTRVARDMGQVRGYRLDNGQLHLSLTADGALYQWRPAAP
jgi:heat shock protein HslJ